MLSVLTLWENMPTLRPHDRRRIHSPRHSSKAPNELDLEKSLQVLQRHGPGESPGASDY